MTRKAARAQARREVSQVYAVEGGGVVWGVTTYLPGQQRPTQSSIGSYRQAVAARGQWIRDRTVELVAETVAEEVAARVEYLGWVV